MTILGKVHRNSIFCSVEETLGMTRWLGVEGGGEGDRKGDVRGR